MFLAATTHQCAPSDQGYHQLGSRPAHAFPKPIPSASIQSTGETAPCGERSFGGKQG